MGGQLAAPLLHDVLEPANLTATARDISATRGQSEPPASGWLSDPECDLVGLERGVHGIDEIFTDVVRVDLIP